ncbi:MAG: mycothiol system anti-sigma-R factor [Myxococcales bacterium]|nr:MAG: mycothiol system anti-sigma-R factor [Myxococcales bacterium]
MDCSEAIGRMFVFIDKELDQASCSDIQRHLDECGPCLAKYELEVAVKSLVARSCSEVAPSELRDRVRLSIQQISIRIQER